MKSFNRVLSKSLVVACLFAAAANIHAQGTAFTYQGVLNTNGTAANGIYDLSFQLFSAASNGVAGPAVTNLATVVTNGEFTVALDFGTGIFPGSNNWVQIGARTNGSLTFTNLTPLLPITPTPYALAAGVASNALSAGSLTGTIASVNLSGTYTNAVTFNNTNNAFVGDGSGLRNVVAASVATNFSISSSSAVDLTNTANVFVGNGAGLTNLSASQLAGGTWVNAQVAGISNTGAYVATNTVTAAGVTLSTNAHLTLEDQSGTIVQTKSGGIFEILMTNGNAFIFSNGSLTILSNGTGLAYSQGSLTVSSNLVVSNDTTIWGNLDIHGTLSGVTLATSNLVGSIPLSSENAAVLTNANAAAVGVASNFSVGGNLTVSGVISGNGSGITNLPGATVAGVYTNAVTFSNAANVFVGDGSGLSNVVASSVIGGASLSASNAVQLTNTANVFVGNGAGLSNVTVTGAGLGGVYSNTVTFTSTNNLFVGDGSGLSNVTAVALAGNIVPLNLTNSSNVFVGDGAGLSNVTATVVSSAAAVNLTNTANSFVGNGAGLNGVTATALSSAAAVNLTNAANVFVGNGAGLSNVIATLSGVNSAAVTISNASDVFAGDGSGLVNLNASNLTSGTIPLTVINSAVLTNSEAASVNFATNLVVGGDLTVSGALSGNGGGLTNLIGTPLYGLANFTYASGTTVYCPLTGGGTNGNVTLATATNLYSAIAPRDEVFSHLTFTSSAGPGVGNEFIIALYTNGVLTGWGTQIVGSANQIGSNFTGSVTVPAGTQEMLGIVSLTSTPGPVFFNWSMLVK